MEELLYFRNTGQIFLMNINFNHVMKSHYFYPWMGEVQNKEDKGLPTETTVS